MDPIALSTIVVSAVAPFTPFLLKIATSMSESLSEKIAKEGGEKVWETAQSLWKYIQQKLNPGGETEEAARMVARKPEDKNRQMMLIELIASQIKENPELANELTKLLGDHESVQKIIAINKSLIEDVSQRLQGRGGQQLIEASDDSTIRGARQTQEE